MMKELVFYTNPQSRGRIVPRVTTGLSGRSMSPLSAIAVMHAAARTICRVVGIRPFQRLSP